MPEDDHMEEDTPLSQLCKCEIGRILSGIEWDMVQVEEGAQVHDPSSIRDYSGDPPGLKPEMLCSIQDPFDAVKEIGGLDDEFICKLASNSNKYFLNNIAPGLNRNKRYHNHTWQDISKEEMYRFLGILLKISLSPIDGGGYEAYFDETDKSICGLVIRRSAGFASKHMKMWRSKQIWGSFHPVDQIAGEAGDKAYRLRHAINQFNNAAHKSFHIGLQNVFDEGGILCRSRRCPIRMYNPQKPDKFRVEFFILACSDTYVIHNIDVYQGKNAMNIDIDPKIKDLLTTQKYVLNAVMKCGLAEDCALGARHLALDNRYACPELLFTLREWFSVNATGTCHQGRKG